MTSLEETIRRAYRDSGDARDDPTVRVAAEEVLGLLDRGELRAASPRDDGSWEDHPWIREAILLCFRFRVGEAIEAGDLRYWDKIPPKRDLDDMGVRVVPPGSARYGSYLERGAILMPGYVNVGARVGAGSMVDTWATVGSCAQVGRDVHLAGGVGIGGVLEPPTARPVVVEDGAFLGSRCVVVEGVHVGREAVLGAGTVLTATTPIIDVTGSQPVTTYGTVPERAVVIPGTRVKSFPAGEFAVPCALLIGSRNPSTDKKTSLNAAVREYGVPI